MLFSSFPDWSTQVSELERICLQHEVATNPINQLRITHNGSCNPTHTCMVPHASVWKRITMKCPLSHMLLCTSTPIHQLLCSYLVGAAAIQYVLNHVCDLAHATARNVHASVSGKLQRWWIMICSFVRSDPSKKNCRGRFFLTMVPLYIDTQILKIVISSNVRNWQNIKFINGASIKQLKNKRFTCTKRTCSHHRYSVWLHRPNL